MDFQYHYNLTGSNRKPLVEAASQLLGCRAVYQGAPSFSYTVGEYTISKDGVLSCTGNIQPETARALVESLREKGFTPENGEHSLESAEAENSACEEKIKTTMGTGTIHAEPSTAFTVEIPGTGFTPEARENLEKIIASKETLLKEALGAGTLPIEETGGKLAFPWFTLHGLEGEADAYSRLIAAICNMAKAQKRVTATEKPVENAKYSMRLFLIRLGFIGDEYKTARKILLRNLSGNSSWKSGYKPEQAAKPQDAADSSGTPENNNVSS